MSGMREILTKIYYDVLNPAGYSSVQKLFKAAKKIIPSITIKEIKQWLKYQQTYTRHRKVIRSFPRRKTISQGIDDVWQIDLCDLSKLSRFNSRYKFLLTVIDVFSRYAFVRPLKNKTGLEVSKALENIFEIEQRKPLKLGFDEGLEFYNRNVKALLDKHQIKSYSVYSDTKMAMVERFNRTLKSRMWKYFTRHNTNKYLDILQDLVNAYNRAKHRIIGMAPVQVNKSNEVNLWKKLYSDDFLKSVKYKFDIGETVRISKIKKTFEKGYTPNWTSQLFVIYQRRATNPVTYKLMDLQNEQLKGSFYEYELLSVAPPKLDITEHINILKSRKKGDETQYFIHYNDWDTKFDQWINRKDLDKI